MEDRDDKQKTGGSVNVFNTNAFMRMEFSKAIYALEPLLLLVNPTVKISTVSGVKCLTWEDQERVLQIYQDKTQTFRLEIFTKKAFERKQTIASTPGTPPKSENITISDLIDFDNELYEETRNTPLPIYSMRVEGFSNGGELIRIIKSTTPEKKIEFAGNRNISSFQLSSNLYASVEMDSTQKEAFKHFDQNDLFSAICQTDKVLLFLSIFYAAMYVYNNNRMKKDFEDYTYLSEFSRLTSNNIHFTTENPTTFFIALSHHFIPYAVYDQDFTYTFTSVVVKSGSIPTESRFDNLPIIKRIFEPKQTLNMLSTSVLREKLNFAIIPKVAEWTLLSGSNIRSDNDNSKGIYQFLINTIPLEDFLKNGDPVQKKMSDLTSYLKFHLLANGITSSVEDDVFTKIKNFQQFIQYLAYVQGWEVFATKGDANASSIAISNVEDQVKLRRDFVDLLVKKMGEEAGFQYDMNVSEKKKGKIDIKKLEMIIKGKIGDPALTFPQKYLRVNFSQSSIDAILNPNLHAFLNNKRKQNFIQNNVFFRAFSKVKYDLKNAVRWGYKITIYPLVESYTAFSQIKDTDKSLEKYLMPERIPESLTASEKKYHFFIVHYNARFLAESVRKTVQMLKSSQSEKTHGESLDESFYLFGHIVGEDGLMKRVFAHLGLEKKRVLSSAHYHLFQFDLETNLFTISNKKVPVEFGMRFAEFLNENQTNSYIKEWLQPNYDFTKPENVFLKQSQEVLERDITAYNTMIPKFQAKLTEFFTAMEARETLTVITPVQADVAPVQERAKVSGRWEPYAAFLISKLRPTPTSPKPPASSTASSDKVSQQVQDWLNKKLAVSASIFDSIRDHPRKNNSLLIGYLYVIMYTDSVNKSTGNSGSTYGFKNYEKTLAIAYILMQWNFDYSLTNDLLTLLKYDAKKKTYDIQQSNVSGSTTSFSSLIIHESTPSELIKSDTPIQQHIRLFTGTVATKITKLKLLASELDGMLANCVECLKSLKLASNFISGPYDVYLKPKSNERHLYDSLKEGEGAKRPTTQYTTEFHLNFKDPKDPLPAPVSASAGGHRNTKKKKTLKRRNKKVGSYSRRG